MTSSDRAIYELSMSLLYLQPLEQCQVHDRHYISFELYKREVDLGSRKGTLFQCLRMEWAEAHWSLEDGMEGMQRSDKLTATCSVSFNLDVPWFVLLQVVIYASVVHPASGDGMMEP